MPGTFIFKPIEATIDSRAHIGLHPENLDPYCKIKVGNITLSTHPSRDFGPHPRWNDDLVVQQGEASCCKIMVKDRNKGTIGEVKLDLDEVEADGKIAKWFDIWKDNQIQGQLLLEVIYTSANPQSRAWHLSAKEGAAIPFNGGMAHIKVKGHVSPSEIRPFRVIEKPRTSGQPYERPNVKDVADVVKHIGVKNINTQQTTPSSSKSTHVTSKDVMNIKQHMGPQNLHTVHTHKAAVVPGHQEANEVAKHIPGNENLKAYYAGNNTKNHPVTHIDNRDISDVKAHLGGQNDLGQQCGCECECSSDDSEVCSCANGDEHLNGAKIAGHVDNGYIRVQRDGPVARHSEVHQATRKDLADISHHIYKGQQQNGSKVHQVNNSNAQDIYEIRKHLGNQNVKNAKTSPSNSDHSSCCHTTGKDISDVSKHLGSHNLKAHNGSGSKRHPLTSIENTDVADVAQHLGSHNLKAQNYPGRVQNGSAGQCSHCYQATNEDIYDVSKHLGSHKIGGTQGSGLKRQVRIQENDRDVGEIAKHLGGVQNHNPRNNFTTLPQNLKHHHYCECLTNQDLSDVKKHLRFQEGSASKHHPITKADNRDASEISQHLGVHNLHTHNHSASHSHHHHVGVQGTSPISGQSHAYYPANKENSIASRHLPGHQNMVGHECNSHLHHSHHNRHPITYADAQDVADVRNHLGLRENLEQSVHVADYQKVPELVDHSDKHQVQVAIKRGWIREPQSSGNKRDSWYLDSIGMSNPNTASLGVNHRPNNLRRYY